LLDHEEQSSDQHQATNTAATTYIIHITGHKLLPSFCVCIIQHLVEENDLLFQPTEILEGLRAVIWLGVWIRARKRFHQLLCCDKIARRPATYELLELSGLGLAVFFLKLFRRF
jgi:hypothetical protein